MLGDKNWDEREGDSYKTMFSALPDLVGPFTETKNLPVSYAGRLKDLFFRD